MTLAADVFDELLRKVAADASLGFWAPGLPAPQGSKRHVGNGVMIESSKHVKPWRESVKWAAREAADASGWVMADGPVVLSVVFLFLRPKNHYGAGKNSGVLKKDAPIYITRTPDLSKLIRSTEDALVDAGIMRDDSLIVEIGVFKRYGKKQGAQIWIGKLQNCGRRFVERRKQMAFWRD